MNYAGFTVAIPNYTSLSPMLEQLNRSFAEDVRYVRINSFSFYVGQIKFI